MARTSLCISCDWMMYSISSMVLSTPSSVHSSKASCVHDGVVVTGAAIGGGGSPGCASVVIHTSVPALARNRQARTFYCGGGGGGVGKQQQHDQASCFRHPTAHSTPPSVRRHEMASNTPTQREVSPLPPRHSSSYSRARCASYLQFESKRNFHVNEHPQGKKHIGQGTF